MPYSTKPRDWTFVKAHGSLSLGKNMSKDIDENLSKNLAVNTTRNFLIILNNLLQTATNALKTACEREIQKGAKQLVIWLAMKLLIKKQWSQEVHYEIVQWQFRV